VQCVERKNVHEGVFLSCVSLSVNERPPFMFLLVTPILHSPRENSCFSKILKSVGHLSYSCLPLFCNDQMINNKQTMADGERIRVSKISEWSW